MEIKACTLLRNPKYLKHSMVIFASKVFIWLLFFVIFTFIVHMYTIMLTIVCFLCWNKSIHLINCAHFCQGVRGTAAHGPGGEARGGDAPEGEGDHRGHHPLQHHHWPVLDQHRLRQAEPEQETQEPEQRGAGVPGQASPQTGRWCE